MTTNFPILSCILLIITILTISAVQSRYTYDKYTEGSLFSGQKIPFTLSIPIRIGLLGFNENSSPPVKIDTDAMVRSLIHTLESYIPRDLDHGKYLNVQFKYLYDVYHVPSPTQMEVEELLAQSLRAAKDGFNRHVVTHNPRKINSANQLIPFSPEESSFLEKRVAQDPSSHQSSPLYEINIGEIDTQIQDILLKSLSDHLRFTQSQLASSKSTSHSDSNLKQTKRGPDKEYSIFILNPSRHRVMDRSPIKPVTNATVPAQPMYDFLYGYTGRSMADVVKSRQAGLGGHFGSYSYTNTWVSAGRMIIADVQAISSVGTTLDRQDAFLEEILSNIYKTMATGSTTNTLQQQSPFGLSNTQQSMTNHGEAFSSGETSVSSISSSIDIYRSGLLSKRYQQQSAQTDEITLFFTGQQEGKVVSTGRANTLLPSLLDTSSLTTIMANPSAISTLQQVGLIRANGLIKKPSSHNDSQLLKMLGNQITPLLSSYVSSAIKQIITTDITIPHQQLPIPTITHVTEAKKNAKNGNEPALMPSVLTIPIIIFTDHSFHIKVDDVIDMNIIEKMVSKLSITTTVKIVPLIHNIHTFPSVSTTLFGSIGTVSMPGTQTNMMFAGPAFYNVLNGDAVTNSLFKAALTSPILASILPNQSQQRTDIVGSLMNVLGASFLDEKDAWFDLSISGHSNSASSARNYFKSKDQQNDHSINSDPGDGTAPAQMRQNQVIPVVLFSIVALPQESTIIYPDTTSSSTGSASGQASGSHQKRLILHVHNIQKQQANLANQHVLTQLRKELTLKVMSSLISKLTGSIPPYLKYAFSQKVPLPGLVNSDDLAMTSSTISLYTQVQPSATSSAATRDTVHSITLAQRQLTLGFTTQHKQRTQSDRAFLGYDEQNDFAVGRSLAEFIDSTWTIGMHTYGPYATMYKSTKIYRDASRRNIVAVAISELLSKLWGNISSTCDFMGSYGFLSSSTKWQEGYVFDPFGNQIEHSAAAINQTLIASRQNDGETIFDVESDASNDIMRFMTHNDWINMKRTYNMNCFLPFKPVPEFRDQEHDKQTKALLAQLDEVNPHRARQIQTANLMFRSKKESVEEWMKSNGVDYDQRMIEYLAIHNTAPIYVLTQMIRIADMMSSVEQRLFALQRTLDTALDMTSANSVHDNYGDYWQAVFVQLYHFAHRVSMFGDITNDIKDGVKSTYASCRVLQKQVGGEYLGYGYGQSDEGIASEYQRSLGVHKVSYNRDIGDGDRSDGNSLLRDLGVKDSKGAKVTTALSTRSSPKTLRSQLLGLIALCFIVAVLLFFIIIIFVVVCADCCGISPSQLFATPPPQSQKHQSTTDASKSLNSTAASRNQFGQFPGQDEFEDERPLNKAQMYGFSPDQSRGSFQPSRGLDSNTAFSPGLSQNSKGSRTYSTSRDYQGSSGYSHEPNEDETDFQGFNNTISSLQSYLTEDSSMDNQYNTSLPQSHGVNSQFDQMPPSRPPQPAPFSQFSPMSTSLGSTHNSTAMPPSQFNPIPQQQQQQQQQQPTQFSPFAPSPPIQPPTIQTHLSAPLPRFTPPTAIQQPSQPTFPQISTFSPVQPTLTTQGTSTSSTNRLPTFSPNPATSPVPSQQPPQFQPPTSLPTTLPVFSPPAGGTLQQLPSSQPQLQPQGHQVSPLPTALPTAPKFSPTFPTVLPTTNPTTASTKVNNPPRAAFSPTIPTATTTQFKPAFPIPSSLPTVNPAPPFPPQPLPSFSPPNQPQPGQQPGSSTKFPAQLPQPKPFSPPK